MTHSPLFSIILPTKNNQKTIKRCLQSIENQTYKNIEVIFVDNFSDDETLSIAKSFENSLNIKIFQHGPERHKQREFGFEQSTWQYVYFIDSDMYAQSDLVEKCVSEFTTQAWGAGIIVPEKNVVEWYGYWAQVKAFERSLYDGDDTIEAARVFSREMYSKVWWYNQEMISGEDWDLSQRIEKMWEIRRVSSFVWHDEGNIDLWKLLKKKFYYGSVFPTFVQSNGATQSVSKIYFFRPVFYRSWRKYISNLTLFMGMIIMLSLELFAGGMWYMYGTLKAKIHSK